MSGNHLGGLGEGVIDKTAIVVVDNVLQIRVGKVVPRLEDIGGATFVLGLFAAFHEFLDHH